MNPHSLDMKALIDQLPKAKTEDLSKGDPSNQDLEAQPEDSGEKAADQYSEAAKEGGNRRTDEHIEAGGLREERAEDRSSELQESDNDHSKDDDGEDDGWEDEIAEAFSVEVIQDQMLQLAEKLNTVATGTWRCPDTLVLPFRIGHRENIRWSEDGNNCEVNIMDQNGESWTHPERGDTWFQAYVLYTRR